MLRRPVLLRRFLVRLVPAALVLAAFGAPAAARADAFTVDPAFPTTGQAVSFDAGSSCLAPASCAWDLDGDGGFNDEPDETGSSRVTHTFAEPGPHVVRLQVTPGPLLPPTVSATTVQVRDRPPFVLILVPNGSRAGQSTQFVAVSKDPDDAIASEKWDLDGDGAFDDALGTIVRKTFTKPGKRTVAVRVADAHGGVTIARRQVTVAAAPLTTLTPFPVVRIRGALLSAGLRVDLLTVTAPKSASIVVRCAPRCGGTTKARGTGRAVRFARFTRLLRKGVVLTVRVGAAGRLGKYTSFRIVGGSRGYVRRDACLKPGASTPSACGS